MNRNSILRVAARYLKSHLDPYPPEMLQGKSRPTVKINPKNVTVTVGETDKNVRLKANSDGTTHVEVPHVEGFFQVTRYDYHKELRDVPPALLIDAFREVTNKHKREIETQLDPGDWIGHFWEIPRGVFGRKDGEEWEKDVPLHPKNVRVYDVVLGNDITVEYGQIRRPFKGKLSFDAVKKAPLKNPAGPFTSMSDQELNKWITKWADENPEGFWMDGELQATARQAFAMYRKEWRGWSPREQQNMMDALGTP